MKEAYKTYKLRDLVIFKNGKGHEKFVESDGKYILLTSKAISTDFEEYRTINIQLSPVFKNDVVLVMSDLPNGKALAKCFIIDENDKYTLNQRICSLTVKNDSIILPKYLYYILNRNTKLLSYDNGVDQTNLKKDDILDIEIDLPSIDKQIDIINKLDKFEELLNTLKQEINLTTEQFEYYIDKLIDNNSNFKKFSEIATIVRGGSPRPINNYITNDDNGINWIKIGDVKPNEKYITETKEKITIEGSKKSRFVKKGDFILSNSMSYGRPYILKIDGCIHDGWLAISDFEKYFTPDFLYYVLTSKFMQKQMDMKVSSGNIKNLNADIVKSLKLPIYSFEEQNRIVSILDKFEELLNDKNFGLNYSLSLREQQYEYYRDLLLGFKELRDNE